MKTQKNKIVFVLVLVCMVLFITIYSIVTFGKPKKESLDVGRIPMPDLEDTSVEFETKLEAVEAIKEEKQSTAPQVYPDHMVDDKVYFNPDYMEYEKHRIIDSLYQSKSFVENAPQLQMDEAPSSNEKVAAVGNENVGEFKKSVSLHELALNHQLFFASKPRYSKIKGVGDNISVLAYVDGVHTLREGHRLAMRLEESFQLGGTILSRGTQVYGFVKLRPNRVMVEIDQVGEHQIRFQAYDFQDGQVGIYVENHLKGEIVQTSVDETLSKVNLPGLPQFGGIKRIFERNRQALKVEVADKYKIVLKQEL